MLETPLALPSPVPAATVFEVAPLDPSTIAIGVADGGQ